MRRILRSGLWRKLADPTTVKVAAATLACSESEARAILRYLAHTTDLLECVRGPYKFCTPTSSQASLAFHLLRQDAIAGKFEGSTDSRARGSGRTAKAFYAAAFEALPDTSRGAPGFKVLQALGASKVVDLGSGAGGVLISLAEDDVAFAGWGIDTNGRLVRAARLRARAAGMEPQVKFSVADVQSFDKWLNASNSSADALHAANLLNQFSRPWEFLRKLRRHFPSRLLVCQE